MSIVVNPKPTNQLVIDPKPTNQLVLSPQPKNQVVLDNSVVYLENRTILKGQPIPFGLNWLITYPASLTFQAVRS